MNELFGKGDEKPTSGNDVRWFQFIFKRQNRGLLLDIVVFIFNLFLMRLLVGYFLSVARAAEDGDGFATITMFLFSLSLFVLPPAGAVMKRWHYHERLKGNEPKESTLSGCLFNPIFYFCLVLVIFSLVNAFIMQFISPVGDPAPTIFIGSIFLGLALSIVNTWLVYRYFIPPKKAPASPFLLSPASELIGDICLFLNMLNFQIIWNLLSFSGLGHPSGVGEFVGRLFVLCFIALLIYFPPRMFYLAEDINKRRTWLIMLIANSPVIFRVLIGTSSNNGVGW